MAKFKIGDRVKCTREGNAGPPAGTTGTVIETADTSMRVKYDGWNKGHGEKESTWWLGEDYLARIDGTEKKAEKPVFSTGKKYKVIGNSCGHGIALGTIIELNRQHRGTTRWYVEGAPYYIEEADLCDATEVREMIKGEKYPRSQFVRGDMFSHSDKVNPEWVVTNTGSNTLDCTCKHMDGSYNGATTGPDIPVFFMGHVELDGTDKIAVKINSKSEWDRVLKKCYEMGSKFQEKEPKYETGYRYIYPRGELKNDAMLCGYSEPQTVAKIVTAAEFLGEKTTEKDPDRYVYCLNCKRKTILSEIVRFSHHKWRELEPGEREAVNAEKPAPTAAPKHELIKAFGNTPTQLDYPPEPVKIAEKIEVNHCPICRCHMPSEIHASKCPNSDGRIEGAGMMGINTIKTVSDKPPSKKFARWFNDFSQKLMA